MTSTMKSEPARPPSGDISFGTSVSAAICCADGGITVGSLADAIGGVTAPALLVEVTAAPVTATPARNLRRLTSERGSFRAIFGNLPSANRACPPESERRDFDWQWYRPRVAVSPR